MVSLVHVGKLLEMFGKLSKGTSRLRVRVARYQIVAGFDSASCLETSGVWLCSWRTQT